MRASCEGGALSRAGRGSACERTIPALAVVKRAPLPCHLWILVGFSKQACQQVCPFLCVQYHAPSAFPHAELFETIMQEVNHLMAQRQPHERVRTFALLEEPFRSACLVLFCSVC